MKPKEEKKNELHKEGGPKAETPLTDEQLRDYAGDYFSDELRVTYRLEVSESKLKLTTGQPSGAFSAPGNNPRDYLRATGTDEFELGDTGITVHFRRDPERHVANNFTLDA